MQPISTIIWYILEVASQFYLCAGIMLLACCCFDEGFIWNQKKKWMLLLLIAWDILGSQMEGIRDFLGCFDLILLFLWYVYGSKDRLLKRLLFIFRLFMLGCFFVFAISSAIYYLIPGYTRLLTETYEAGSQEGILADFILLAVFAPLYYYLMSKFLKKGVVILLGTREKWLLFFYFLYTFTFYFATIFASEETGKWTRTFEIILGGTALVFCLIFPVFIFRNRVCTYYQDAKDFQELMLQTELEHFQQYKQTQEEMRRFRHDIQNNLTTLNMLLEQGKANEAEDYLKSLLGEVQALSPQIVTGDAILDCIFSSKWEQMKKQAITFQVDGVLDHGLSWNATDICTVFANALDNAIEACAQMPEGQERRITVTTKKTNLYYCIEISNTVVADVNCDLLLKPGASYTSKKNRNLHGFGLQNMKRAVERCGGILKLTSANHMFKVSIIVSR